MDFDRSAIRNNHGRTTKHHPCQHFIIQILLLVQAATWRASQQFGIAYIQIIILIERWTGDGKWAIRRFHWAMATTIVMIVMKLIITSVSIISRSDRRPRLIFARVEDIRTHSVRVLDEQKEADLESILWIRAAFNKPAIVS